MCNVTDYIIVDDALATFVTVVTITLFIKQIKILTNLKFQILKFVEGVSRVKKQLETSLDLKLVTPKYSNYFYTKKTCS